MRKILFLFFLIISVVGYSQPTNYVWYKSRTRQYAFMADGGMHIPTYISTPTIRNGIWTGPGNIGIDTTNNKFYFYSGGAWREAGSTNYADSLRRVGLDVQMRKGGVWTNQFDLPDSIPPTIAAYNETTGRYNYGGNTPKFIISENTDSSFLKSKLFLGWEGNNINGEIYLWSEAQGQYQSIKADDGELDLSIDGVNNTFVFSPGLLQMIDRGHYAKLFFNTLSANREYTLPDASGTLAVTLKNTTSLNFTSTAAQSSSSLTMTVTDAAVGDAVVLDVVTGGSYLYTAYVSSSNTVTVTLHNYSSAAVDPAAQNFTATVIKK